MKAPEKIYITNYDIPALPKDEQLSERWHEDRTQDTDIEYVRTDVFIEKAVSWMKENITNSPNVNSVLMRNGCVTLGMLVNDFKKYMEGE